MTLPLCPIPADAKVGDVVIFRDGQRKKITDLNQLSFNGQPSVYVEGYAPGGVLLTGESWDSGFPGRECVGFVYAECRVLPPLQPSERKLTRFEFYVKCAIVAVGFTLLGWVASQPPEYTLRSICFVICAVSLWRDIPFSPWSKK